MKGNKLTLDFSDIPEILTMLRQFAGQSNKSQKEIVVEALTNHFSNKLENLMLLRATEETFAEWDNTEDDAYNNL